MQLFVTGATGLVGAALVEAASALGWTVVAFDRSPPPPALARAWNRGPGRIISEQGDIRDARDLGRAFQHGRVDYVVHAATITSAAAREALDPYSIVDVNLLGTIRVLEASKRADVERFIYVSSNAAYGASALTVSLLDEESTVCDPSSLYGITKFAAERTTLRLGDLWGRDVRIARLSSVFGPWERDTGVRDTLNPMLQVTLAAMRSQEAVLERPCRRDWIYSRDVASALIALLQSSRLKHLTYNVAPGTDRVWAVADWCACLEKAFPGFRQRIAGVGETPNIDVHEPADRAPMNARRLFEDTEFRPAFGLHDAFNDMINWIATQKFTGEDK